MSEPTPGDRKLADELWYKFLVPEVTRPVTGSWDRIVEFIAQALADERERAAKVAEAVVWIVNDGAETRRRVAAAIREGEESAYCPASASNGAESSQETSDGEHAA